MTDGVLLWFSACEHCGHRDRYPDGSTALGLMCNGCGHFEAQRFIGVTVPEIAEQLLAEFPEPTVNHRGVPV